MINKELLSKVFPFGALQPNEPGMEEVYSEIGRRWTTAKVRDLYEPQKNKHNNGANGQMSVDEQERLKRVRQELVEVSKRYNIPVTYYSQTKIDNKTFPVRLQVGSAVPSELLEHPLRKTLDGGFQPVEVPLIIRGKGGSMIEERNNT